MCIWIQYKYVDFICLASNYWKFRRKDSTGCFEMVVSSVPKVAMACARKQCPSSNNNANKAGMTTIGKSLLLIFESPLDSDSSQCHTIDAQIEKMWNLFLGQQNVASLQHKSRQRSSLFSIVLLAHHNQVTMKPKKVPAWEALTPLSLFLVKLRTWAFHGKGKPMSGGLSNTIKCVVCDWQMLWISRPWQVITLPGASHLGELRR